MKPVSPPASLAGQAADALRAAIAEGTWTGKLPGEVELSRRLHVSRNTLRVALAQLEREGVLSGGRGRQREILRKTQSAAPRRTADPRVVLLTPEPLHRQAFSAVLWMDALRDHLQSAGCLLELQMPLAAWRRHPARVLEEIAARLAPAAWILHHSTAGMQRWFSARGLPCLIVGTRHPGVALPSVDSDHRAVGRHAASRLVARGRRELAILHAPTELAGDAETCAGFREGAGRAAVRDLFHNDTPSGVCATLQRAFHQHPPDGLFVFHSTHTLTTLGHLTLGGVRVPTEVSVISRDDDPVLAHAVPEPARYVLPAEVFARKTAHLVDDLRTNSATRAQPHWVMPEFLPGGTL
ncbi:MAG: substrate-binding domain-containing protein [Verrucomicrobiales bacterium]|nr:substrate-binding domain-containing protein [Verrucomicrobiales bacterium]